MNVNAKTARITRFALTALVSTGVGLAGLGLAPATAHADPNTDWGPAKHWCPGEPLPATGNHVTDPLHDWNAYMGGGADASMDAVYDYATVNGKMLGHGDPIRVKQGERVLFHVLNASATEIRSLALPGHFFHVVAA